MPLSISSIPGHGSNIDTRGLFSALRYCSREKVVECTFYATSFPGSLLFPSPRDPGTRLHPCSVLSYFPAVMFLTVSLFLVNGPACR